MEVLIYLIPYLLLFITGIFIDKARTSIVYWLYIVGLALFSGFRYDVGYDYRSYYNIIEMSITYNMEPINAFIISLCEKTHFTQLFFIIHSVVTVFTIGLVAKKISPRPGFSILIFIGFPLLFLNSMSVVRFWSALSLVFLGSVYLQEGSIKKYLICMAVASGFHLSAIVGFLFLAFKWYKMPLRLNWIILMVSYILSFISKSILSNIDYGSSVSMLKFSEYVNAEEMASGFSIIPYIYLLIDIMFLIFARRLGSMGEKVGNWVTIYNIGCSIMFLLSFNTTLSMRMSRFFIIYLLILIPYFVKTFKDKSIFGYRTLWITLSLAFYVYQLCIFNTSLMDYEFLPYKLFFNEY